MISINLEEIPKDSGVYLFKGERGEVLYVGKAKNLKARITSYFKGEIVNPKIQHLLHQAKSLEYFLTTTEKEALLLEATLIKKYKPKYNVLLKDDKNYPLLRLSLQDPYPALQIVRNRKKGDKALYFGPFTSSRSLKEILRLLSKTFPLRKCSLAEMQRRKNPCIYFQIKKCLAPCVRKIPKDEYDKLVKGVIDFFQGKGRDLIEKWNEEMHKLSENLDFEKAAFLRDRIRDLEALLEKQSVVLSEAKDIDLWESKIVDEREFFIVLFIRYGYLYGFQTFSVKKPLNEGTALKDVLLQYYTEGRIIPPYIVIPYEPEEFYSYNLILSEYGGTEVKFIKPENDPELLNLKNLALKNLENYILQYKESGVSDYDKLADELKNFFKLEREPYYVEAIDLSQYAGSAKVGALVAFVQGVPEKRKYKHYKIKGIYRDDFSMLYEVVYRRLKRGIAEKVLPDLLLIDGGKGHLEVALSAARDLGLDNIEIRSVAKNEKRNPEKAFLPGRKNPKFLPKHKDIYHFIGKILAEAHRFAITFSQKTLQKINMQSLLDEIPGIGPKRKQILLTTFSNWKEILNTPEEEIAKLPGFNLKVAKTLKSTLSKLDLENTLS
ncbi:MAG: excinuclease ABC subunit UvrC [Caldimicrobium sp.]